MKFLLTLCLILCAASVLAADFDGTKWNVSTGNVSVTYIQHSPIGAHPSPSYYEPPPSVDELKKWKSEGLVADEDYIAWGAVEREPGEWDWKQHDAVEKAEHAAGLKYVVYDWVHFPPTWLRNDKQHATLMKCLEHNETTNYLSIFDPKTLEHYDHFYKALHDHFGDKIDDIYACILGPYGEGNYPLNVPDWVNIGHCHEGYWCGDDYALKAYSAAMAKKYGDIAKLNTAWGASYKSFDDVRPPKQLSDAKFKPSPDKFNTPQLRREWLDFITWYHQAIIDFAEGSIKVVLKYFPKEKVRTKPGGNAGGVNPIAWGTYCPGYAKMAEPYGIVLQPADFQGAIFGDSWVGTAYQFYHVTLSTEPAGGLNHNDYVRRMFSDASVGASQHFTYEFQQHVPDIQKYIDLYTGKPGDTQVAVYCPTTLYRLGGDLEPTIRSSRRLRDVADFDVLDELLITDGALSDKYKLLVIFQGDVVDQPILDAIDAWVQTGGSVLLAESAKVSNVEEQPWKFLAAHDPRVIVAKKNGLIKEVETRFKDLKGVFSAGPGVWTTQRGDQTFMLNTTDKPLEASVPNSPAHVTIEPHTIYRNH